jgi:hypothetical protein
MLLISFVIVFITYREVKKVVNKRISAEKTNSEGFTVKYQKFFSILLRNNNISNSMLEIIVTFWHSSTFTGLQSKKN